MNVCRPWLMWSGDFAPGIFHSPQRLTSHNLVYMFLQICDRLESGVILQVRTTPGKDGDALDSLSWERFRGSHVFGELILVERLEGVERVLLPQRCKCVSFLGHWVSVMCSGLRGSPYIVF